MSTENGSKTSPKKINQGKIFENQWVESTPDYAKTLRLPDPPQSFAKTSALRFSKKNPFDFLLWNSKCRILFALELKTVAGSSVSFERCKGEHGVIHYHQIQGLNDWNQYDGTICGFIIEFRKYEKTIFLDISTFNKLISIIEKKSFNLSDLDNNELPYFVIPQQKLRTKYRYDIDNFLNKTKEKIIV